MLDNINAESSVETIVAVSRAIMPLQAILEKEKAHLKSACPESKFTSKDGSTVAVSKKTEDRVSGTVIRFDETAYSSLEPEIKASLERLGVVKIEPKIVKGQEPKITVKLSNV